MKIFYDPTGVSMFQELVEQVLNKDYEPLQERHAETLNELDKYHFEGVRAEDFEITDKAADGLPYVLEGQDAIFHFNRDSRESYFTEEPVRSLENELRSKDFNLFELQEDVKALDLNVGEDRYEAGFIASYYYPELGRTVGVNVFPIDEGNADLDIYIDFD